MACEFALGNKLKILSRSIENEKAGKIWWFGFQARHNLSIRSLELTSVGRASGFNKHTVDRYFDYLAKAMNANKYGAEQIFNVDETWVATVQNSKNMVTAIETNIGSISSGEKSELVTAVSTICASGSVLPPMLIFERVNYLEYFVRGKPQSCIGKCNRSGWITEELIMVYLNHIIKYTYCGPEHEISLMLENHKNHISLSVTKQAKSTGIVMLAIPPNTSHQLQRSDKSRFGLLKPATM